MGIAVAKMKGEGSKFPIPPGKMVWVVFRRVESETPALWHLQGIASSEAIGDKMCRDETYIMGPVPVDAELPTQDIDWVGSYFPRRGERGSAEITILLVMFVQTVVIFVIAQIVNLEGSEALWTVANVVFAIINGLILLRSKIRKDEREAMQNLLGLRLSEIDELKRERDELQENLDVLKAEYKTVAGTRLDEIIKWASSRDQRDDEFEQIQHDLHQALRRLKAYEKESR